jgi:hypothetical protein
MLNSTKLYLLNKLLNRIKYSEFDEYEINEFANNPITNEILKSLINTFLRESNWNTFRSKKQKKSNLNLEIILELQFK